MSHDGPEREAGAAKSGSPPTADDQSASASAGRPRRSSPLSTGSFIVAILVLAVLGALSLALLATWWESAWR